MESPETFRVVGLIVLALGVLVAIMFLVLGDWHSAVVGVGVTWAGAHLLGKAIEQPSGPVSVTNHHHATKAVPRGP